MGEQEPGARALAEKTEKREEKPTQRSQLRPNTRISSTVFKGSLSSMNGNVFELPSERRKRGQFRETLNALRTLASMEYKKEILYLEPLFRKLEDPVVEKPVKPKGQIVKSETGEVLEETGPDPVDLDIYKEEIKNYVGKKERLRQAKSSLFIVAMGQCSDAMTNKLKAVKGYEDFEKTGT